MERPIFLFSSGWRTGSTLLQRFLCSHPDMMIWGENRGILECFERAGSIIAGLEAVSTQQRLAYQKEGPMGWIAVMNPPLCQFREGMKRLLETYYRDPAIERGRNRWGFKEVRHGLSSAKFLHALYEEARFLLLLRHPADCLASARATETFPINRGLLTEIGGPKAFLEQWTKLAADFLGNWTGVPRLVLRYEDLVNDREESVQAIARFIGAGPGDFDRRVFEVRRRGWLQRPPRLTSEDRECLQAGSVWRVAERYGYMYNLD